MKWLEESRAEDEEVVAIMETDACCADAVQVLTGCTFGKGNFIYRDFGKMALTLFSRKTGKGVRVSMRPEANRADPVHMGLLKKIMAQEATDEDRAQFQKLHYERSCDILEIPQDVLFSIKAVETKLPPHARMEPSVLCAECGEPTMPSKMEDRGNGKICRGCAG
jgi:formylmethanofuran dehydrogenase subunit E